MTSKVVILLKIFEERRKEEMTTSTGTSIKNYLDWIEKELEKKDYGEVSICFVINRGIITDVRKESVDKDHFNLPKI
jgi:hypothetical protein